jgi:hypothetical protein
MPSGTKENPGIGKYPDEKFSSHLQAHGNPFSDVVQRRREI